jgi:hypothetical protein
VPGYASGALLTPEDDPRRRYTPDEFFTPGIVIQIRLGEQPSGRYLYLADLDSHTAGQDADAARARFEQALPHVARALRWRRSKSGKGWHVFFLSYRKLTTGKLYDAEGRHIGELLGKNTDRTRDPGDIIIPFLDYSQVDELLSVWGVRGAAEGADTWSKYVRAGAGYTRGWERERANVPRLGVFLETYGGDYGKRLAALGRVSRGERSELISSLVNHVLLHVHKLDGERDFYALCRRAYALLMQADGFGKAAERTYNYEKDVAALIAKIVSNAPRADGYHWFVPFWAKGRTTAALIEADEAPAPRPRGRPAGSGNTEKRRARLRRILSTAEPDAWGRIVYTLDDLGAQLKAGRRTVQADLAALRDAGEISTGQIGGNGRPFAILLSGFGGAIKSRKPDRTAAETRDSGGAISEAPEVVQTPQTADPNVHANKEGRSPQSSAPDPAPGRAHPGGDLLPAPAGARRGRLGALVAEGFDAYADAPRHRRKRAVLHYVAANGGEGADPAFVEALYDTERDRRNMATWTPARLRRSLRIYEAKADAARDGSGDLLWLWRRLYRDASAELARRPATPGRKARKNCEVLPDLRKTGERKQAELWAVAEQALAGRRGAKRSPAPGPLVLDDSPRSQEDPRVAELLADETDVTFSPLEGVPFDEEGPGTPQGRRLIASLRARPPVAAAD